MRMPVPDGPDVPQENARRDRADVFELLQSLGQLRRSGGLAQQLRQCAVAALQLPADFEELGGGGKVIADVVRLVEEGHQAVPSRAQNGVRRSQPGRDKLPVGLLGDFRLNGLSEEEAGQKPLEYLFLFPGREVDP